MQVGPYRVVEQLAQGGMGAVFRALDPQGRLIALKILHAARALHPVARRRFQAEVEALARLRHPHVVQILAAGEHEGTPWLALELVEGESLEDRLRYGPLPVARAVEIAQQLAGALSYVHACGLLHRDVKPANVLIEDGLVRLTDFGLVRDDQSSRSRITNTGVFQGTPGYWAPEQARGEVHRHGPPTDVYGLGGVLYACLTGRPPQEGSVLEHLQRVDSLPEITPPARLRPEVPPWLDALTRRCLAPDPSDRPPTADAVALELARELAPAAPQGAPRWALPALLALGLVAVSLVAWDLYAELSEKPTPVEPVPSLAQPAVPPPAQPAGDLPATATEDDSGIPWTSLANQERAAKAVEAANALAKAGRSADALEAYDEAIAVDPGSRSAWHNRGAMLGRLGRYEEAVATYTRALVLDPSDAQGYANRALNLLRLHRDAEAVRDLDRAIRLGQDTDRSYADRGTALARLGRYRDAHEDFSEALRIGGDNPILLLNRALAAFELGHYREAYDDANRALELEGLSEDHAQRLRALRARATERLEAPNQVDPDRSAETWIHAGQTWLQRGDLQRALDDFERASELEPQRAAPHLGRAEALRRLGRFPQALAALERALALDPRDALAHAAHATLLTSWKHWGEGIQAATRALELDRSQVTAWVARGACRTGQGDYEAALLDYQGALAVDPDQTAALLNLATCKARLGRQAEAIPTFDRLLELDPLSTVAYKRRGQCHLELEQLEHALRDYTHAVQLDSQDADAWANRGYVAHRLGKPRLALDAYSRALSLDPAAPDADGLRASIADLQRILEAR